MVLFNLCVLKINKKVLSDKVSLCNIYILIFGNILFAVIFFPGTAQYRYNQTLQGPYEVESAITSTYDHGHWSKPYFDCGGGFIWMMTYTVPFFGYKNGTFKFK